MAHVIAEGKEHGTQQYKAEKDAENRACAKGQFPVVLSTMEIVIVVIKKVAHESRNALWRLVTKIETDSRLGSDGLLLDVVIVLQEIGCQVEELAERCTQTEMAGKILLLQSG